jgi:hypothetical protein
MKILNFRCNLCKNEIKKLFKTGDTIPHYLTCECSGVLEKQLPDFSTTTVEVVDNGIQAKRLEIRKDAQQKFKERGENYIKTMNDRDKQIKKGNE